MDCASLAQCRSGAALCRPPPPQAGRPSVRPPPVLPALPTPVLWLPLPRAPAAILDIVAAAATALQSDAPNSIWHTVDSPVWPFGRVDGPGGLAALELPDYLNYNGAAMVQRPVVGLPAAARPGAGITENMQPDCETGLAVSSGDDAVATVSDNVAATPAFWEQDETAVAASIANRALVYFAFGDERLCKRVTALVAQLREHDATAAELYGWIVSFQRSSRKSVLDHVYAELSDGV